MDLPLASSGSISSTCTTNSLVTPLFHFTELALPPGKDLCPSPGALPGSADHTSPAYRHAYGGTSQTTGRQAVRIAVSVLKAGAYLWSSVQDTL